MLDNVRAFTLPDCYAPGAKPFYRLWHDGLQKHFYTASPGEADYAVEQYGFRREQDVGYILRGANSQYYTQPLHRLYKESAQDHFYTHSAAERDYAVDTHQYTREGVAAYVFRADAVTNVPPAQPAPFFESNFTTGQPGSTFLFSAGAFPPESSASMSIQAPRSHHVQEIAHVSLNADGELVFVLMASPDVQPGTYTVRMAVQSTDASLAADLIYEVDLTIGAEEPARLDTLFDQVPTFSLDAETGNPPTVYLPFVVK